MVEDRGAYAARAINVDNSELPHEASHVCIVNVHDESGGTSGSPQSPGKRSSICEAFPRTRLLIQFSLPLMVLLFLFAILNLMIYFILPESDTFFSAISGAATIWGVFVSIVLCLGVLHSLRLLFSIVRYSFCLCRGACSTTAGKERAADKRRINFNCPEDQRSCLHKRSQKHLVFILDILVVVVCYILLFRASVTMYTGQPLCPGCAADDAPVPVLASRLRFPANFKFGSATSAYQVEGGLNNSNWFSFESFTHADGRPGIVDNQKAGLTANAWNLFDEDLARMRSLNLETFRLSLSWSRLNPSRDVFDEEVLLRYRTWLMALRASRIEPMVTLLHYEEPSWIMEQGSWLNKDTVDDWLRFVQFVSSKLGDVVDLWVTQNEPFVMAGHGWMDGRWPPGKASFADFWVVLVNLMTAHKKAFHLLHETDTVDADGDNASASVGLAKNYNIFRPRNHQSIVDSLSAGMAHFVANSVYLAGADVPSTVDWLGVNHYFRMDARFLAYDYVLSNSSLGEAIYELNQRYDGALPFHVTEHGTSDENQRDWHRASYVTASLSGLQAAMSSGAQVDSYQYWSLLDNFEWDHGTYPRYGLFEVNFSTFERTPRDFASMYANISHAHASRHGRALNQSSAFR